MRTLKPNGAACLQELGAHLSSLRGQAHEEKAWHDVLEFAQDVPTLKHIKPMARQLQKELYDWDVFVCHAGPDKPFALALSSRLPAELRRFVDEESLIPGDDAPAIMEFAVKSTQISVVLLSHEFFCREDPKMELRWILQNWSGGRTRVVPVFLGLTVEECSGQD